MAEALPVKEVKREIVRVKKVQVLPPTPTPLFQSKSPPPGKVEMRYEVTIEVDAEFMELLEEAKVLTGSFKNSEALKKVLKAFIHKKSPAKREERRTVREEKKRSRHIPNRVRDRVSIRDNHQCSYVSPDGRRCTEKRGLEIDHIMPFAKGGDHSEANLRLICPAHNMLMAKREFGAELIQRAQLVR